MGGEKTVPKPQVASEKGNPLDVEFGCFKVKEGRSNMNRQWSVVVLFEAPKPGQDGPAALRNAAFVQINYLAKITSLDLFVCKF